MYFSFYVMKVLRLLNSQSVFVGPARTKKRNVDKVPKVPYSRKQKVVLAGPKLTTDQ